MNQPTQWIPRAQGATVAAVVVALAASYLSYEPPDVSESASAPESAPVSTLAADLERLGWYSPSIDGQESTGVGEPTEAAAIRAYANQFTGGRVEDVARHVAERVQHPNGCSVPDRLQVEEANWPHSCRDDIGMAIDWRRFNASTIGFSQARAEEIFSNALDEFNRQFDVRLHVTDDFPSAKCAVRWEGLSGNTLAWSHLADNSCRDDKLQRYDIRGWDEHQFFITVIHECGHLLGMNHSGSRNDVMYPTIQTQLDGLQSGDKRVMRSLGYNVRTTPPEPEEPDNPGPGPIPDDGYFYVMDWVRGKPDGEIDVLMTIRDGVITRLRMDTRPVRQIKLLPLED